MIIKIKDFKKLNEGLVDHAEQELKLAGMMDPDADYNGMVANAVIELIKTFAGQGHSGFSAGMVRDIFAKLANYETLTPLTSNPDEWQDTNDYGTDEPGTLWQSKRCPMFFSNNAGSTWYNVDDKTVEESKKLVFEKLNIKKQVITSINEFKKSLNEKFNDSSIDYAGIADPNFIAEEPISNYHTIAEWPDGEFKGIIKGYDVYSDATDSGFKCTTGYRNMFPITCYIVVENGHAIVYSRHGVLFSDKETEDQWRAKFGRGRDALYADPNFVKYKEILK